MSSSNLLRVTWYCSCGEVTYEEVVRATDFVDFVITDMQPLLDNDFEGEVSIRSVLSAFDTEWETEH